MIRSVPGHLLIWIKRFAEKTETQGLYEKMMGKGRIDAVGQKQAFMYFCIVLQLKIYKNLKKKT